MRCGSRTLLHTCTIPDPLNHWCLRDWLWAFSSVLKLGNYRLSGLWDAKQQQFNFVFINLFYWHSWFTMLCWFLLYNKVIQLSVHSVVSDSVIPWTAACQAFLSITNSWSLSDSCPLSRWCHPPISSSVMPFSSCLQSYSSSFPVSQFFATGGQSIGVSASSSVLPMNIQDWFSLGWTGWISLQSKGFSRVFSNTTVQKHQFFVSQLSLWSNSHIHAWLLEIHSFDYMDLSWQSNVSAL